LCAPPAAHGEVPTQQRHLRTVVGSSPSDGEIIIDSRTKPDHEMRGRMKQERRIQVHCRTDARLRYGVPRRLAIRGRERGDRGVRRREHQRQAWIPGDRLAQARVDPEADPARKQRRRGLGKRRHTVAFVVAVARVGVSVGLDADARYRDYKGYGVTTFTETTSTLFSGGVRFGVNARLGESISWYPRLTLMLASSHTTVTPLATSNGEPPGDAVSQSSVGPAMNLYAPLLLHPASHFVVGFGPRIYYDFTVGGWWGAEASDREEEDEPHASSERKPEKSAELFGGPGQVVLTTATDASIGHRTYSNSKCSETYLTIEPGIDYFVTDHASIGATLVIAHSGGTGLDYSGTRTEFASTSFGLELGAGYNLRLSAIASIWLRGNVGFGSFDSSVSSASGTNQHNGTRGWVDASTPLLVHPATHFFVGAGPFLFRELSNWDQYNRENKATRLGLSLVLGGWFGGPRDLATLAPLGTQTRASGHRFGRSVRRR